jgi:predicted HTH transcriptional regulator
MKESQQVEWKRSWRDDCLRWICGFANAEGGRLVIGRDDRGTAVGVKDARRLLEEIPNKVRDLLGIMADVNLRREKGKELVEIRVEPAVKTPVKTPERIVELLRSHPYLTLAEVAEEIGKSLRTVERAAARLAETGRIRYVGPRKGGHWETLE